MKKLKVLDSELEIRLSPSFIQNAACPAYLKARYIDRVRDRFVRVEAERGKAAHGAIAELLTYAINHKIDIEDLDEGMVRDAVQKHISHRILSEVGLVLSWVMLWRERFRLPRNVHGVEDRLALNDEFDECAWDDASYRGILDLHQIADTHCVITDWKSQPYIVPQSELDQPLGTDMAEQLTFYAWLAWKTYPTLETFTVRIWYLRYGFYMETSRREEDLVAFENALMIKERKITEIDSWDPIPGKHCQFCDYIHICPIAQDLGPGNSEVITQEQAVIAAQKLTVFEAYSKILKAKLKTYVNANDDVRIGDNWIFGYQKRQSVTWKPKEVDPILREHDHELHEVTNIDVKKMKKFIKDADKHDPVLASALEDISQPKYSSEFKGYRLGEQSESQGEEG